MSRSARLPALLILTLLLSGCYFTKESRMERYVAKGFQLKDQKRYQEALAEFENALAIDPRFMGAVYGVGLTQMEMGNFDDAYRALKTVVVNRPDAYNGNRDLARLLIKTKRFQEARLYAQAAFDLRHGDPEARELYVTSFSGVNDLGNLEDGLGRLVRHDPASLAGVVGLASQRQLTKELWAAEDIIKAWMAGNRSAANYQALGNFYWSVGKPALAGQNFQQAADADANSPAIWYSLGLFHLSQAHPELAEPAFQKVVTLNGGDALYHGALGRLYIYEGALEKGIAELRPVVDSTLARFPEDRFNFDVLMGALIEADRKDAVDQLWKAAASKAPDDARLKLYHGILTYKSGAFLPAERELDAAAEKLQDPVGAYYAGLAHQAMEDDEETLNRWRSGLKYQPADLLIRLKLADYLANVHSNSAALTLLNEAPPPQGQAVEVRLAKARVTVAQGEWLKAEQELGKLIEENPQFSGAYTQLGLLNLQKRNLREALAAFDKALQLDPKDEAARQGKKAVNNPALLR